MRRSLLILVAVWLWAGIAHAQTVTLNGTNSPPPVTLQNAVTASGNGTAITTTGFSQVLLDVTCATCSGGTTVNFEESADTSVWTAVYAYQVGTASTIAATTTATGMFQIPVGASVRQVRARVSGYSAGTVTVKGYLGLSGVSPIALNTNVLNTVTVGLPALAATSTKQSDGSQKTQIVDGSGNVIASTSNNLNVQCANCSGSGASAADSASFTATVSTFAPAGGFFQTTATSNPLTTGQQGMFQVTAQRALFSNLRNASGTEVGTSSTPFQVSLANTGANTNKLLVTPDSVALPANQSVNVSQLAGTTTDTNSGSKSAGTLRVVLATDQPALTNKLLVTPDLPSGASTAAKQPALGTAGTASSDVITVQGIASMTKLLVTPDSVALPANQSVNVSQINAVTPLMGNGASGTGAQRVTIANDSTGIIALTTGAAQIGHLEANQSTNIAQMNGVAVTMGNGASGTGVQRVTLASDSTGIVALTTGSSQIGHLEANQSVNTAQVNGVTVLTGTGATGTGAQRVTVATDSATVAGSASLPTGTNTIGSVKQTDGTNIVITDPCQGQVKSYKTINQTGNTNLVTGTSAKKLYVCSIFVFSASTQNIALVEGTTGGTCGSGTAGLIGGTTAGTGPNLTANQGWTYGSGIASIIGTATNNNDICLFQSGGGQVSGSMSYVVQ